VQKEGESVRNGDQKICFLYFWCLTGALPKAYAVWRESSSGQSCSQFPILQTSNTPAVLEKP